MNQELATWIAIGIPFVLCIGTALVLALYAGRSGSPTDVGAESFQHQLMPVRILQRAIMQCHRACATRRTVIAGMVL